MSYKQLDAQGPVQESIRILCHKQWSWPKLWGHTSWCSYEICLQLIICNPGHINCLNDVQEGKFHHLKSLFHFFQFLFFFFCFHLQFLFENLIHVNAKLLNFTSFSNPKMNFQESTQHNVRIFHYSHTVTVYLVTPHYPDLDYLDFFIVQTCFSGPSFLWILISYLSAAKLFSFKLYNATAEHTEFVLLQSTKFILLCFFLICTITNTVHVTKVWLAQIYFFTKWNFIYSSLSYLVLLAR